MKKTIIITALFSFLAILSFGQQRIGNTLDEKMRNAIAAENDEFPVYRADIHERCGNLNRWFSKHPEYYYIGGEIKDTPEFGFMKTYYGETYFVKTDQLSTPEMLYKFGIGYYENEYPYFCPVRNDTKENQERGLQFLKMSASKGYVPALLYCGMLAFDKGQMNSAKSYFYAAYNRGYEKAGAFIAMVEEKERQETLKTAIAFVGCAAIIAGVVHGVKATAKAIKSSAACDAINSMNANEVQVAMKNGVNKYITGHIIDREKLKDTPIETTFIPFFGNHTSQQLHFLNGIEESLVIEPKDEEPYFFSYNSRHISGKDLNKFLTQIEDLVFDCEMYYFDLNQHFSYKVEQYMEKNAK